MRTVHNFFYQKAVTDFYRSGPDWIKFRHSWQANTTYLEKLKVSG